MPTSKAIQLKKHKAFATGLFLLMVAVYLSMVYLARRSGAAWIGFVHAFSEAAMVGALADWFAVTALFRYPLGLRIPHTNLIENKKKDIGNNLGNFVKENFLTAENIRPYVERMDVVSWISKWLRENENQKLLVTEIAAFSKKILADFEDSEVVAFLSRKVTEALRQLDFSRMAASGIQYVLDKEEHIKILDSLLPEIKLYAEDGQDLIRERINKQRPLIGFLAGKKISKEFTQGIVDFIDEVDKDKHHWLREKITKELEKIQYKVAHNQNWQQRINSWKDQFIIPEKIQPYAHDAWNAFKTSALEGLSDKDSVLMQYLRRNIEKIANDLQQDENLQNRINNWVRKYVYTAIMRNRDQVETLIGNTVAHWQGRELSEKLELEVGKDLQFIRVNGTVVGGLVGLLIYSLTLLLSGR
ncbi:MAG: DUF445 domain-containing protein [Chitinophagaceae bacterium]